MISSPRLSLPLSRIAALIIALAVVQFTVAPAEAQQPTAVHIWSKSLAGSGNDIARAIAFDNGSNVYVTGSFEGTVTELGSSAGGTDIFLAKYDANGTLQWAQRFGGLLNEAAYAVAVTSTGDVVIAGEFNGSFLISGTPFVSSGDPDIFIAKFSSAGAFQWGNDYGGTGTDRAYALARDGSGNVYMAGEFSSSVSFGGGALNSAGITDIFLVKFTSLGAHAWSQRYGGTASDAAHALVADGFGNLYMTGTFNNTINFGGGNLVSAGSLDAYLAKINFNGLHQWSQRLGGTAPDVGLAITLNENDNMVYLAGEFDGTSNWGGSNLVTAGGWDIVLAKYDTSGTHQWSKRFGGTGSDIPRGIGVDQWRDDVIITGFFDSPTIGFGGFNYSNTGLSDVFLARFGPTGKHMWSSRWGGVGADIGYAVVVDFFTGIVHMAGAYTGSVFFGGPFLPGPGGQNAVVAQYAVDALCPVITSIVDVGNDQGREVTVQFNRSAYDAAGALAPVLEYEVYRRLDPPPSSMAAGFPPRDASRQALLDEGWQYVANTPAHGQSIYVVGAPTIGDSTIADGLYTSTFFVRAATATPTTYFDSPSDGGYSLDNLAPSVPLNFVYTAGNLSWEESEDADFDYFTVYGSESPTFNGSAVLIDYTIGTGLGVVSSPYTFYYVTATDFSGNEGKAARVNTLSGVGKNPPPALSVNAYPNPFNPNTTIHYTVPAPGRVVVRVYDARGARVATLVDGTVAAGARTVTWNGRDFQGAPVSSGVYVVEVRAGSESKSRKITLLK